MKLACYFETAIRAIRDALIVCAALAYLLSQQPETESEISFETNDAGIVLHFGSIVDVDLSNHDALQLASDIAEHVR